MEGKEMTFVHINDEKAQEYIPREHIEKMAHQMLITGYNFEVYLCTEESGVVFKIPLYCSPELLDRMKEALLEMAKPISRWTHEGRCILDLAQRKEQCALESHLHLWTAVNNYVLEKGPLHPVNLLRHSLKDLYSKTKGGVDCTYKHRAGGR